MEKSWLVVKSKAECRHRKDLGAILSAAGATITFPVYR